MYARITKSSGHSISEAQILFYVHRGVLNEQFGHCVGSGFYN